MKMKLLDIFKLLFPDGYYDWSSIQNSQEHKNTRKSKIRRIPYLCTDLFALTSVLLQRSGAYHHVAPEHETSHATRLLKLTSDELDDWVKLGAEWRGDYAAHEAPKIPKRLVEIWDRFWSYRNEDVFVYLAEGANAPDWWRDALALMIIADEAAHGLGFATPTGQDSSYQTTVINRTITGDLSDGSPASTFSFANPDVASVLPKSRTPSVGCTLRSLSHNLALLPSRGLARAYWLPFQGGADDSNQAPKTALNCLLIPLPYRISAKSVIGDAQHDEDWGWFRFEPEWCANSNEAIRADIDSFCDFVLSLVNQAERDLGEIHVIVFPELALSSNVFRELLEIVAQRKPQLELIVSGLFDRKDPKTGAVAAGNFSGIGVPGYQGLISHRPKHHRWRLDRSQINAYALGSALDPNHGWWEDISILTRSLDVFVLRGTTTVTTLICEDLARNDPCQELVRGIGPNIVFALLMDGPQIKERWPARYATVLAEDPGSSVLSFTSLGLIERSNGTGRMPKSRMIGLWRDDRGETVEIHIPDNAQAITLSLQCTDFEERTLDGRRDGGVSESWRLEGIQPVRLDALDNKAGDILAGRWPRN
jgi:hypothetical protein